MRPEVIVHHLAQAEAVLLAAGEAGVDVQLRSAPGAAGYAGVGYLKALGETVGHELLIDCGDDAGVVMAALRAGCNKLMFTGKADERQRLGEMAERQDAALQGPSDPAPPSLALLPDEDGSSVRPWLEALHDR
ncbi:MAG: hypothetical protein R3F54_16020 [Alphaproteobacteria bacterium]